MPARNVTNMLGDLAEVLGLVFTAVIVYPLFYAFKQSHYAWLRVRFLFPRAILGTYLQARFRSHLGQNSQAAVIFHQLLSRFESEFGCYEAAHNVRLNRFLQLLYQEFMLVYVSMGDLDQAASVLIRAHNHIGCQSFPSFSEFSLQTAHIVKAGFAAGRLLDDESIKGLFQSGRSIIIRAAPAKNDFLKSQQRAPSSMPRQGAKIIPFPSPKAKI